jgi:hypothetical protein
LSIDGADAGRREHSARQRNLGEVIDHVGSVRVLGGPSEGREIGSTPVGVESPVAEATSPTDPPTVANT